MTHLHSRWRAGLHGRYWYINDFDLCARRTQDYRNDADAKRWLYGNYFRSEHQAMVAARHIHEVMAAVHEATDEG